MQADSQQSWLIYAMGGGFGHLNRALSLARQSVESDVHCTILHNCRYASIVTESKLWNEENLARSITLARIPSDIEADRLGQQISRWFAPKNSPFDRVIVDCFPRGLAGELAELLNGLDPGTKRVLVARDVNPDYVEKFDLLNFARKNYEVILNPGEAEQSSFSKICTHVTAPWVVRRDEEILVLRQTYLSERTPGVTEVLVTCAGKPEETEAFAALANIIDSSFKEVSVNRLFATDHSYWPGIDRIADADVVIGSGGYNTINECKALGIPLIAFTQPRLYDRQSLRAKNFAFCEVSSNHEAMEALEKVAVQGFCNTPNSHFSNGTTKAVQLILGL